MLCGKQSGTMKSRIFPESAHGRTGPVECHEVWDWTVPDEVIGVGVQRLKALLVVCFECHAVFHGSFMVEAARRAGLGTEVESFIEARRRVLTRMTSSELADSLSRTEAEFASQSTVGEWVMDLSSWCPGFHGLCLPGADGGQPCGSCAGDGRRPVILHGCRA